MDAPTSSEDGERSLSPEEAFALLGNENRMSILRVLWEADDAVPFSDLRERVGVTDSGNFNYHLDRLVGQFVRRTDDGYELRYAGEQVVRAVLAGAMTEDPSLGPVEIPDECPYCESAVELRYRDERLTARCTGCEGVVADELAAGTYMHYGFPPAGLDGRSPEEVLQAAHTLYDAKVTPMMDGVCPECAGTVTASVDVCRDHDARDGEVCPDCGCRYLAWTEYVCETCAYTRRCASWFAVLTHPAVIGFYYEHGDVRTTVPFRKLTRESAPYIRGISESVARDDPLRVDVAIGFHGETIRATVDAEGTVVDVSR